MEDLKPNSNKYKTEQKQQENEKRVEKVVTGKIITKKKSAFSKFAGEFISEDSRNVSSYIVGDVLIPALKKLVLDIIVDGANIIFYGGTKGGSRRPATDRVSYRNYYDRDDRSYKPARTVSSSARYFCDDIFFETRGDAEDVLRCMDELIASYGVVSVADMYDLVGKTGSYTDNKYGWSSTRGMNVERTREGYYIDTPRAMPID